MGKKRRYVAKRLGLGKSVKSCQQGCTAACNAWERGSTEVRLLILGGNKLRRLAPHSPLAGLHGTLCDAPSQLAVWRRLQLSGHLEATGIEGLLIVVSGSALSRLRGGAGWRACAIGHVT